MMVKDILNCRYGIHEACIADNLIANISHDKANIVSVAALKNMDMDGRKVLLCQRDDWISDTQVTTELLKYVSIYDVIDIFSPSMFF